MFRGIFLFLTLATFSSTAQIISTFAGTGTPDFQGDGGSATAARLKGPIGVAVNSAGEVIIADTGNFRIRRVAGGIINTIAGNGSAGFSGDGGPALSASFDLPNGVAVDAAGNIYVVDTINRRIRRFMPGSTITTVVGGGSVLGDGGPPTLGRLADPWGMWVDAGGSSIYIADTAHHRVRGVGGGVIFTQAGNGIASFSGDGGPSMSATVNAPHAVLMGPPNFLYVADTFNHRVRRIDLSTGIITTVVGNGSPTFGGDGGPATMASLNLPTGLAWDTAGRLVIADSGNNRIRRVDSSGNITTIAGNGTAGFSGDGGSPTSAALNSPRTIAFNSAGDMFIADSGNNRIRRVGAGAPAIPPQLSLSQSVLNFQGVAGGANPAAQALTISNSGGGTLNFTAAAATAFGGNWLSVSSSSGTATSSTSQTINVTANLSGLAAGVYSGTVTVTSPTTGQTQTVNVTLVVQAASPTIQTTTSGLLFNWVEGSPGSPPAQNFGILNTGAGTLNWTLEVVTFSGGNWLSVSSTSGSSSGSAFPTVNVSVNTTGLNAGQYSGLIRVVQTAATNSPQLISVHLNIAAASANIGAFAQPAGLIFVATAFGGLAPAQSVSVLVPGVGASFSGSISAPGGGTIQVTPASGSATPLAPASISIQPLHGGLPPGVYRATLTLTFSGGSSPKTIDLILVVIPAPAIEGQEGAVLAACTPTRLLAVSRTVSQNFNSPVGWPTTLEIQVVDDCGNPITAATAVASFSNGDPPLTLTSLRNGTYSGTWKPVNSSTNAVVTVRVQQAPLTPGEVILQGSATANNVAALFAGGIVHAASFAPNAPLAPGMIVSAFGSNLATGTNLAPSVPLGTSLGGASLNIGGRDAPLFFSNSGQINAQIPFETSVNSRPSAVARVRTGGAGPESITVPETLTIATARPGIFTISQDGKGQGAILDGQGRLVDSANPASAGQAVAVYCTGLGVTTPAVGSGLAAPSSPLALVTGVSATVGGITAPVVFQGLAPGFVGLYQVNVQIPAGVTAGAAPLVLTKDGVPSNQVTVGVR